MSAGQVGEGRTTSEKQSAPQGKDADPPGPETLKHKKKKEEMWRGGEGEGQEGDTTTGLMVSCTVVAHECMDGGD